MMDLLIGQQRSTESFRHDQPMFDDLSLSSDEMAQLRWYPNVLVSLMDAAHTAGFANRDFGPWVARREYPFVMSTAIAAGLASSFASLDLAHFGSFP